ncbi:MAG: sodium-translocating pyrophosphatase [Anaerolineae bacterium]|nr:sodium-translocating pyrophosphatase [Anaerolineae bacterium]
MEGASAFEIFGVWSILLIAIVGLLYALLLGRQILREPKGTKDMEEVAEAIRSGAQAYLNTQFRTILWLIVLLAVILFFSAHLAGEPLKISIGRALAFVVGATFSGTVGYVGMSMAVQGNVRVAAAARRSFGDALRIAYRTGTITGMLTDGLGLLGGTIIFLIYGIHAKDVLLGFGFGGTLLALFMRVGGGIYTKAADVGADLVGKVEQGVPEDDPRNAAVVADLVGDNVGDCAGMAADIFESYEVTIVSAMILGIGVMHYLGNLHDYRWIVFPLMVRAIGVLSSIIGTYAVNARSEQENAMDAIKRGYNISAITSIIGFFLLAKFYANDLRLFWATLSGIILAVVINYLTDYFTGTRFAPVQEIARSTRTGSATTILTGLATGYESTVWAILVIAVAIGSSILIFRGEPALIFYGVALTGIGMLTLTGNNVSMDAFGPIADNANGIGEMVQLEPSARNILAHLDAVGNTTKAITKGIAIGSAVIAAVCLFGSFTEETGIQAFAINVVKPEVFIGLLVGGAIPFLFSSLTIRAVARAASLIIVEVRRQFRIPGLMEGLIKPDYAKAVTICTRAAQRELIGLGLLAVLSPVIVGFALREEALGAFLAGIILTGQLLAVFMANAGGAWDNAKKTIEDGLYGGKGSEAHKASVVGDTVGDPLKDTSGPALNPMIKVVNLVSVIIAPIIVKVYSPHSSAKWPIYIFLALCLIVVGIAIWYSKKEAHFLPEEE